MNNRRPTGSRRPDRSHGAKPYNKPARRSTDPPGISSSGQLQQHLLDSAASRIKFIEKWPESHDQPAQGPPPAKRLTNDPFRILIAVHRPRFRGRTERASAITAWNVVSLLNKQDVVGHVEKGHNPPDIVVLSSDFGRQKSFGIFRAIQSHRSSGMKIVGMVESCEPDETGIDPKQLCDVCLTPPYKTTDLNALFRALYEEIRGEPALIGPQSVADTSDVDE